MNNSKHIDWKKYAIVFAITGAIFSTALYASNYFNNKRIYEIKRIQDSISTSILSSETQFSLLSELSCKDVGSSVLSDELNSLAERIEFSAQNLGAENKEVIELKKFYSLLEIKDYILMKRISERCGKKFMFAFYFYGNEKNCQDCQKTSLVLTYLREKYPALRVYSFDYNLDLSAVKTLATIFKIKEPLPIVVIGDETINGFKDKEEMEKILQKIYPKETKEALDLLKTKSATTTEKK
ncbi:MAG: hypothetical protein QG585_290 [Patescibacteria group bacterium]|jgi:hypothetical protein|nr:hypothetical protein [Patescibacteria group bacterium]